MSKTVFFVELSVFRWKFRPPIFFSKVAEFLSTSYLTPRKQFQQFSFDRSKNKKSKNSWCPEIFFLQNWKLFSRVHRISNDAGREGERERGRERGDLKGWVKETWSLKWASSGLQWFTTRFRWEATYQYLVKDPMSPMSMLLSWKTKQRCCNVALLVINDCGLFLQLW